MPANKPTDMIDSGFSYQARDYLLSLEESERREMLDEMCKNDAQEFMKQRRSDFEIKGIFGNRYRTCRLDPQDDYLSRMLGQQRGILEAIRSGEKAVEMFGITASPSYYLNRRIKAVKAWRPDYSFKLGIDALDDITGGCLPSELMVIAGAQGSMKTSLLLGAIERGIVAGMKILFFSLDMACGEVMERRLQRRLDCTQFELQGMIRDNDRRVADTKQRMEYEDNDLFFLYGNDLGDMWDIDKLIQRTRVFMPDVLAIDFLTLLRKPGQTDLECVDECARALKRFAQLYSVRVVILSQMGRASKREQFAGITGGHSKGGGIIEELCHSEIELFKDNPGSILGTPKIVATVTKTRRGRAGSSFALDYKPESLCFTGMAYRVEREKKKNAPVFSITNSFA